MKNFILLIIFISVTAFTQSASHSSTPLEDALLANTRAIHEAQKTKNADLLKRILSDDFVEVGSEGHLHPRAEFVEEARDGELKDYNLYNFNVHSVDENTAIVTYNAIIQMPEGDTGAAPRYQIFSDLWIKDGENWKLKFQQATPLRSID
ncbi:MAG TPA: nuclear transport factor 2 family protein [Terriglobales bacterium]|nr:nuclear transport factor 2 family protein [Terriglobales bacterium]